MFLRLNKQSLIWSCENWGESTKNWRIWGVTTFPFVNLVCSCPNFSMVRMWKELFVHMRAPAMQASNASGVHLYTSSHFSQLYTSSHFFSPMQKIDPDYIIMSSHKLNIYHPGLICAKFSWSSGPLCCFTWRGIDHECVLKASAVECQTDTLDQPSINISINSPSAMGLKLAECRLTFMY